MPPLENPFPGMNPFLELRWPDAHTRLIAYIADALAEELPPELSVRAEERIEVGSLAGEERECSYRSDLSVREETREDFPPLWQPEAGDGPPVAVAEPELIPAQRPPERWLEVRDRYGQLITAIELLSPWNKEGSGRLDYRQKQRDYRAAPA